MYLTKSILSFIISRVGFYNQEKEFDERGLDLKTQKLQREDLERKFYRENCLMNCLIDRVVHYVQCTLYIQFKFLDLHNFQKF